MQVQEIPQYHYITQQLASIKIVNAVQYAFKPSKIKSDCHFSKPLGTIGTNTSIVRSH